MNVKDKKLTRLLNNQNLNQRDNAMINYIYEEK
jgi:hypothetical protein